MDLLGMIPTYIIPIGFDFKYFNDDYNQISINELGLGGLLSFGEPYVDNTVSLLMPYGSDIIDRAYNFDDGDGSAGSLSPLSYKLDGSPGSQILKIEWNNVGFYSDIADESNTTSTDFTNFQLWLFEGTNTIEIHFGPNSISQPLLAYNFETGSSVALYDKVDIGYYDPTGEIGVTLSGEPSLPVATTTLGIIEEYLNGTIPNGTTYNFTNITTSIKESDDARIDVKLYPNPADDLIQFSFDGSTTDINAISIVNLQGQIVRKVSIDSRSADITDLNSGVYFINISSKEGSTIRKFVKK